MLRNSVRHPRMHARDCMSINLVACSPDYYRRYPDELEMLTCSMTRFPRDVIAHLIGERVLDPAAIKYADIVKSSIVKVSDYQKKVMKQRLAAWRERSKVNKIARRNPPLL